VGIVLRYALPVLGVLLLGWSALETLAALFLNSLSTLLVCAAVGTYFVTGELAHDDMDVLDRVNLVVGGVCIFVLVAGLLAFALAVPSAFVWVHVFESGGVRPAELLQHPALLRAFALMLAFQVPHFLRLIGTDSASARRVVMPEVGFVLLQVIGIAMVSGVVALLPGRVILVTVLILAQGVLAWTELDRDRHLKALLATPKRR
jgi:hypothetical protein